MKIFVFLLLLKSILLSQSFSPDIIIDTTVFNQIKRSTPAIDLNSNQDLGIAWSIETTDYSVVKFVKSYNGGITFDSVRIVDHDPHPPLGWFDHIVPVLKFDIHDNPLILYLTSNWHASLCTARVKKSLNNGHSFPQTPFILSTNTYNQLFDYLSITDSLGILAYLINYNDIRIMESLDGGITFNFSSMINCNHSVQYKISLVKCDNDDVLCFWTVFNSSDSSQVYYARSSDNGRNFSNIQPIITNYQFSNGISAYSYQNYVFVTYFAADSTGRYIVFQKSGDNGFTFQPPTFVTDELTINSHPEPEIRFNPNVGLCLIWGQWNPIYFTYSFDYGSTFDTTLILPNNLDRFRNYNSMTISDSGDVYIVSDIHLNSAAFDYTVMNILKLPVLTTLGRATQKKISDFKLMQNYPNPFNSSTQISFLIPRKADVSLSIFDINGRFVENLVSNTFEKGIYRFNWSGRDRDDNQVASGVYVYQLKTDDISLSKKLLYIK